MRDSGVSPEDAGPRRGSGWRGPPRPRAARGARDLDGGDLAASRLRPLLVDHPGGLQDEQTGLLHLDARLRHLLLHHRPWRASCLPNATRSTARSHIIRSARSAMPTARMQWCTRPGPSRAWAMRKAVPLAADDVFSRDADVVEADLGVALVVVEAGTRAATAPRARRGCPAGPAASTAGSATARRASVRPTSR